MIFRMFLFIRCRQQTATDEEVKDIIRTYKNKVFALDYEQSCVIMDGMKTVVCSPQLLYIILYIISIQVSCHMLRDVLYFDGLQ